MAKATLIGFAALAVLLLGGCGSSEPPGDASPATTSGDPECEARGEPVDVATLVRVFRAHGVSLERNTVKCADPDSSEPVATNAGPTGASSDDTVEQREGFVLCRVEESGADHPVRVIKWPGDEETYVDGLNVLCSVYPWDAAAEERQVRRVREALDALYASHVGGP